MANDRPTIKDTDGRNQRLAAALCFDVRGLLAKWIGIGNLPNYAIMLDLIDEWLEDVIAEAWTNGKNAGSWESFQDHQKAMGPWIGAILTGAMVPSDDPEAKAAFLRDYGDKEKVDGNSNT